jgi:hypothetical protein
MNDHVIEGAYSFSSVQVCGPGLRTAFALEHANYFTVLRVEHFQDGKRLPAALVAGLNRVGSKLENTSFLKSRSTAITTPSSDTKYHSAHSFHMLLTPEEYLELAERYRVALETATDIFTRHHLEAMEHSYRTRRTANGRSENLAGWSMPWTSSATGTKQNRPMRRALTSCACGGF